MSKDVRVQVPLLALRKGENYLNLNVEIDLFQEYNEKMDQEPQNLAQQFYSQLVNSTKEDLLKYISMGLLVLCVGIVAFFAGRNYAQRTLLNPVPTPTLLETTPSLTAAPTPAITQADFTCDTTPDCSDIVPPNCTRTKPTYDNNGCMKTCGQLQCESLQSSPTGTTCTTDSDCPKSASCPPGDSCFLYFCVNNSCVLKSTPQ